MKDKHGHAVISAFAVNVIVNLSIIVDFSRGFIEFIAFVFRRRWKTGSYMQRSA